MSGNLLHLFRKLVACHFALDKAAVLCASQATATASAGAAVAASAALPFGFLTHFPFRAPRTTTTVTFLPRPLHSGATLLERLRRQAARPRRSDKRSWKQEPVAAAAASVLAIPVKMTSWDVSREVNVGKMLL